MNTVRSDYAPTSQPDPTGGGKIAAVDPDSPASRAGLVAGDVVVAIFGEPVRDVIDWQWASDADSVEVTLREPHGRKRTVILEREPRELWGLSFTDAVFDGVRTCRNNCAFCFMSQLPRGLRKSLYLRDDDYRLSFLQGNFITLTNLTDSDIERIAVQRLSPLHVSLHSVSPEIRRSLICAREDRALQSFDELLDAGIDLHVQIVLVPGVNDGPVLEDTLEWLAAREGVLSVGVVPLGYTRHQVRFSAGFEAEDAASRVIAQVEPWQEATRARDGLTWVYLADEFYLSARREVPTASHYDDFPQYENGIGIVRDLVDSCGLLNAPIGEAASLARKAGASVHVVTGTMAAPVLTEALAHATVGSGWSDWDVLPVDNAFFGGNVGVVGLLVGEDLIRAISLDAAARQVLRAGSPHAPAGPSVRPRGIYLVPDVIFNADGLTLDGMTLADLRDRTGAELCLVSSDAAGVLDGLQQAANLTGPPVIG